MTAPVTKREGRGCCGAIVGAVGLLVLVLVGVGALLTMFGPRPAARAPSQNRPAVSSDRPTRVTAYRAHRFRWARDRARGLDQLRVVVAPGPHPRENYLRLARDLRTHEGSTRALVQVFDDPSVLEGWDGSGTLRESDWPHWLVDVVDRLGAEPSLRVARDRTTGDERTDVLIP